MITDEELAAGWRAGDMAACEALFGRYECRVYNLAFRMLGNPEDAEDIKQDSFVRAHKAIRSFRGGKFSTWIFRIAANRCLDIAKHSDRKESAAGAELNNDIPAPAGFEDPESATVRREFERGVLKALLMVPSHYRVLLVLKYVDEMPYDQIATVMGCSISALGVRLHRAREVLREKLINVATPEEVSCDEMRRSEK